MSTKLIIVLICFLLVVAFQPQQVTAQYYGYSGLSGYGMGSPYIGGAYGNSLFGNPLSVGGPDIGATNGLTGLFLACSHCNRG